MQYVGLVGYVNMWNQNMSFWLWKIYLYIHKFPRHFYVTPVCNFVDVLMFKTYFTFNILILQLSFRSVSVFTFFHCILESGFNV